MMRCRFVTFGERLKNGLSKSSEERKRKREDEYGDDDDEDNLFHGGRIRYGALVSSGFTRSL